MLTEENILEEYYDLPIPVSWRDHNDANCNNASYNHDEYSDLPSSSKKHSNDITTNRSSTGISIGCYKKYGFFMVKSCLAESASSKNSISYNKQVSVHICFINDTNWDGYFPSIITLKLYHQNI